MIIVGLFKSIHPDKVKKQIFKKMRLTASSHFAQLNDEKEKKLIEVCIHYTLFGSDFDNQEALLLLQAYLPLCKEECFSIFSDQFFGNLVLGKYLSEFSVKEIGNAVSHLQIDIIRRLSLVDLLLELFRQKQMHSLETFIQIHMQTEAIRLLYDCIDHTSFAAFCSFLLK